MIDSAPLFLLRDGRSMRDLYLGHTEEEEAVEDGHSSCMTRER